MLDHPVASRTDRCQIRAEFTVDVRTGVYWGDGTLIGRTTYEQYSKIYWSSESSPDMALDFQIS